MIYSEHLAKGAGVGIRALRRAKRRLPELEATVYGTAPRPDELPPWITYLRDPPQPERSGIYNDHACFVLSSRSEGFGIPGIEAQACGTPLVVTRNGGSADYAHHEVDALVSEPEDVDETAAHIVRALTDADLAERLAVAGRATASKFSWSDSAATIDGLLDRYAADATSFQDAVDVPEDREAAGRGVQVLLRDFYAGQAR